MQNLPFIPSYVSAKPARPSETALTATKVTQEIRPVAKHFNLHRHTIDYLLVSVVKKVPSQSKTQKETAEQKIITELDCIKLGLNCDTSYCFVTICFIVCFLYVVFAFVSPIFFYLFFPLRKSRAFMSSFYVTP